MPLRFMTFNAENLFSRPKVMNQDGDWAQSREVLTDVTKLADLIAKSTYTPAVKTAIKAILDKYKIGNRGIPLNKRPFFVQQIRGVKNLYTVPTGTTKVAIVADGRDEWIGWIELTRMELPGAQVENTGRVIDAVNPDVALLVEVEDRLTVDRFNQQVLGDMFGKRFRCDLLVDGNDPRGIDIGLITRYDILSVRSHIHREDGQGRVFSRDCPEFEVLLPSGKTLWVLGNHFKSKGNGSPAANDKKRRRQAEAVKDIHAKARGRSDFVIVAGDLNDFVGSGPLEPLLAETDLQDVMAHPSYSGTPGTFETGNSPKQKFDYVLLSPALWATVEAVGVERRGIWAPNTFPSFPEVKKGLEASDHAAVWVDLGV